MRGGLNAPRRNTYPKYVPNTLDISSVSGGQPSREVAQAAGGRVLHSEQVRDEQPGGMHATSLEWEPDSGREKLADALQEAILSACDLHTTW
jgi:hypothetical protein